MLILALQLRVAPQAAIVFFERHGIIVLSIVDNITLINYPVYMLANFQQLLLDIRDGLAWLVHGIKVSRGLALCFLAAVAVLWVATMRHGEVEPPRCNDATEN